MLFNGPMMPKNHSERLAMLNEKVAGWRAFVGSARAVELGSSLAADDQVFPVLTPSQLAWHGISSAVDHLDTFMALLRTGTSYPLAPSTIARTGMLSGAHALWLLDGPTRTERQKRGLRLAHEELTRDRQAVRDIAKIGHSDDPAAGLAEMKDYLDLRDEWIARVQTVGEQQFGMTTKDDFRFDDTTLLDTVTRRLTEHAPEWPVSAAQARTWTDATVLAGDDDGSVTTLIALTPTPDGVMRTDPVPLPPHSDRDAFAYGYGGGTPATTFQALLRLALNDSPDVAPAYSLAAEHDLNGAPVSQLWSAISTTSGPLRLSWPQVKLWARADVKTAHRLSGTTSS